jgi:3',5'-nucleoside bisphosphate phosphatase
MLTNAITLSINELEMFVHDNDGLIIAAHIDRRKNSIYSQLGFLPENLKADALEVSRATSVEKFAGIHPEIKKFPLTRSSDAHRVDDIGKATTGFLINNAEFNEIRMALAGSAGRKIVTE